MLDFDKLFETWGKISLALFIVLGVIVFGLKKWISEKIASYFKDRLDKELERYKHSLIKEIELYKSELMKEMELHKLNMENRKYITRKIIDKRIDFYEDVLGTLVSMMAEISQIKDQKPEELVSAADRLLKRYVASGERTKNEIYYFDPRLITEVAFVQMSVGKLLSCVVDKKFDQAQYDETLEALRVLNKKVQAELMITDKIVQ